MAALEMSQTRRTSMSSGADDKPRDIVGTEIVVGGFVVFATVTGKSPQMRLVRVKKVRRDTTRQRPRWVVSMEQPGGYTTGSDAVDRMKVVHRNELSAETLIEFGIDILTHELEGTFESTG